MKKVLVSIILLAASFAACADTNNTAKIESAVIKKVAEYLKTIGKPYDNGPFASDLYNAQSDFQNALRFGHENKNIVILDNLSKLVLESRKNMKSTQFYVFQRETCGVSRLSRPYLMWLPPDNFKCVGKSVGLPKERILETAQYGYFVASLINANASVQRPTSNMLDVIRLFSRILAVDTYHRLIFATAPFNRFGWGCGVGNFTHYQIISVLKKRLFGKLPRATNTKPYCNAVTDVELLLLGGVAELLAANEELPGVVQPLLKGMFKAYLLHGSQLLESRSRNYEISPGVWGQTFGAGDWAGHPDHDYAGFDGKTYPSSKQPAKSTAWDISHARRIVHTFESILNTMDIAGHRYPSRLDMERIANQFYWVVFNGDANEPKFSNFMDGNNGWFRVGYRGRPGYGIAPYALTAEAVNGGFGFLGKYNPEIYRAISRAIELSNNDLQGLPSL